MSWSSRCECWADAPSLGIVRQSSGERQQGQSNHSAQNSGAHPGRDLLPQKDGAKQHADRDNQSIGDGVDDHAGLIGEGFQRRSAAIVHMIPTQWVAAPRALSPSRPLSMGWAAFHL